MIKAQDKENLKAYEKWVASSTGPIELIHEKAEKVLMSPLQWKRWEEPAKLKITNTGCTAVITGHWKKQRPSVIGGPFTVPYTLAQIHFHWGPNDQLGSEHTINGRRFPLEMHVMMYNSSFVRPKLAMRENNATAVIVFVFELEERENESVDTIVDRLFGIQTAGYSTKLTTRAMRLVSEFKDDYFIYRGSVKTGHCSNVLLWLVNSQPLSVNSRQLVEFRKLLDFRRKRIVNSLCGVQPIMGRKFFYATTDPGKGKFLSLSSSFFGSRGGDLTTIVNKRCCSAGQYRTRMRHETMNQIMYCLTNLEKETSLKLRQLEALSRELLMNDSPEESFWHQEIEKQVQALEMKSILVSERGRITSEAFEKWQLQKLFFKEINERSSQVSCRRVRKDRNGERRRKRKEKMPDSETFKYYTTPRTNKLTFYKNPGFVESTSISDTQILPPESGESSSASLDQNGNASQLPRQRGQGDGITATAHSSEDSQLCEHNDDKESQKEKVATMPPAAKKPNFIERNKNLARSYRNIRTGKQM